MSIAQRTSRSPAILLAAALSGACQVSDAPCDTVAATAEIRRADLAMAEAVAAHDVDRFKTFVDPDGAFFGTSIARGPDNVAAAWAALLRPGGPSLDWQPEQVVVSAACDLGYSTGPYQLTAQARGGSTQEQTGTYVTIWKRSPEGAWRVAIDIGTTPSPKAKSEGDS